ncbi:MAG: glycosyltransferase [Gemmatimonadaceae bacterium]
MSPAYPRSVALINPMADFGIDTYTHELAQGLAANGVRTDVYSADASTLRVPAAQLNYRRFHVLGSRFPVQLADATRPRAELASVLSEAAGRRPRASPNGQPRAWKRWMRDLYLTGELALHLKRANYDVVWTQWPDLGSYSRFWRASRLLHMPVVHTVHNILPHERSAGDMVMCETAYRTARLLFVHSTPVRKELVTLFPAYASKVVTIPHGAYTIYPRLPDARSRLRTELQIGPDQIVLLVCGAIRPYKNVGGCIDAMALLERNDAVLIIAGSEPGSSTENPLPATSEHVRDAGIGSRVRLLPGFRDVARMAELFEAADVLLLPYHKSYGSGLLMLGITFGKYILATKPGMEETASMYSRGILLDGTTGEDIKSGIERAVSRVRLDPGAPNAIPPQFQWDVIAANCLEAIRLHLA